MADFSIFDSILDCAFVVDADGKVVYCNEPAATLMQSSVRRMVGKAVLSDLLSVAEANILPVVEGSLGYAQATPFVETEFTVAKTGKTGKGQIAVRPVEGGWLFYMRDVSLEEALHSKYRSELAQKEDYARNLEKLVEARTAELRAVNLTLNAILNSLGQGFFTFDAQGECGSVYTRACEEILEGIPKGRKAWEALAIPGGEHSQFRMWTDSLFKEVLPFDDLKALGPSLFPHSQSRHVVLDYYPIRREQSVITDVVVVATDKTAEFEAQKALEAERQYASMVVKYMKNRDQFAQFLGSVKPALEKVMTIAKNPMGAAQVNECFRLLHTLEGEAGTFSLARVRQLSRESQHVLEPFKGAEAMSEEGRRAFSASLQTLSEGFDRFLEENKDVIRMPESAAALTIEVPASEIDHLLNSLRSIPAAQTLWQHCREVFYKAPIENRLRYYDSLMQTVAERLGKKVKPLKIVGGDLRIYPEPYAKFFSGLVHAFRNAVDHGLEAPLDREFMGKDPAGQITVSVSSEKSQLQMLIADDGAGIDPAVIREKLKEKFPDKDFSQQSDDEIVQAVALPGFSSRDQVGEFSGRGVGLDALREEILKLGGSFHIRSKVGEGTVLEICLPELGLEEPLLRSA